MTNTKFEDIKITGIIMDEIGEPRNDGTPGSALYSIPFSLSQTPGREWSRLFVRNWDNPPSYTMMHRPRIARVNGATVVLNGTTIEEVEKYHKKTLQLAVLRNESAIQRITSKTTGKPFTARGLTPRT